MNHVSEITKHPDFYKKDFLILGTGPSLDNFVDDGKYNVIAIYDAINAAPSPFIHIAPDANYFTTQKKHFLYAKHNITRAFNNVLEKLKGFDSPKSSYYFFEYDCDIKNQPDQINPSYIHNGILHGGDGKRYFPFHVPFPCSCTIKFLANFLGIAGIKKIYTCGVDGGTGITKYASPEYIEGYKNYPSNFDGENKDFYDTCAKFNIETFKI